MDKSHYISNYNRINARVVNSIGIYTTVSEFYSVETDIGECNSSNNSRFRKWKSRYKKRSRFSTENSNPKAVSDSIYRLLGGQLSNTGNSIKSR